MAQALFGLRQPATVYNPTQAALVILKIGSARTVAVFDDGSADEAARLELMKQIGSIAAGRM